MTRRLVRLMIERGRDPGPACAEAGTTIEEVSSPLARVPYRVADALLEACARVLGAGDLSIALAAITDETTYDAAGLVLLASPTFGEGLARAFVHQRLWGDGERFTLRRTPGAGAGVIRFRHPGPSALARPILAELALLETTTAARMLAGRGPSEVRFAHAPLGDTGALTRAFGVIPRFGAADSEIVFDASVLDAPLVLPDGILAGALDSLARRAVDALPPAATLAERVRTLCAEDPTAFSLGLAGIAQRLRMSPRTLQRRLAGEATSWAEIVDEVRRARALELGVRGATEKEIAYLLGFADPSALARARARWRR